jgi:hypothetical protein
MLKYALLVPQGLEAPALSLLREHGLPYGVTLTALARGEASPGSSLARAGDVTWLLIEVSSPLPDSVRERSASLCLLCALASCQRFFCAIL